MPKVELRKFIAKQDGVINNPYRFIEAGEEVTLALPVDDAGYPVNKSGKRSRWLVPPKAYVPAPELPVQSNLAPAHQAEVSPQAPVIADTRYDEHVATLREGETQKSGAVFMGDLPVKPKEPTEEGGTGSQDVLG